MSGDELVVNVDQQEDRLLQDEQEKEQSRDRDDLATRSTSQEAMLDIQTMQHSMRSLAKSVEKLQKPPPTRSNCSDDERRRDSDLQEQHSNSCKRGHSLPTDHAKRNKGKKCRRPNESESSSDSSSSSESSSGQQNDSSNGDDAEGLLRAKTSPDNKVDNGQEDASLSKVLHELDQEYVDAAIGPKVDDQVAKIMNKRLSQRMDIKLLKDKMAKYNRPENCDLIRVPRVNEPVWKSLDSYRKRQDVKLSNIQKTCVAVGGSMAYTLDMLYKNKEKKELDIPALMRSLADTAAMLGHVNIDLSLVRREVMRPILNTEYRNLCNPDHPVTSWLFGDDLQNEMKDVKETNKIGNQMTQRSTASYRYYQRSQGSRSRQYGYNKDFYKGARPRTRYKKFPPKSKAKQSPLLNEY